MPEAGELYMHRIGRTGRADATGTALSFILEKKSLKVEVEINEHGASYRTFPRRVEISDKLIEPERQTSY
jgi:ATP-dependent RNA helicase RhlE